MPCSYPCLLDWNEQIQVRHIYFEIPPVSSRGNLIILARLLGWTLLSDTVSETKT